jgi:hypothetical protein
MAAQVSMALKRASQISILYQLYQIKLPQFTIFHVIFFKNGCEPME